MVTTPEKSVETKDVTPEAMLNMSMLVRFVEKPQKKEQRATSGHSMVFYSMVFYRVGELRYVSHGGHVSQESKKGSS